MMDGVRNVVPMGQGFRVIGAVPNKYANVMQPGGCENDIIVVVNPRPIVQASAYKRG